MGPGPRAGDYGDPITIPSLNLTVEQKTKLYDLRINHLKQIKPFIDKMFIKQGDLRLLWSEKNPDRTKILAMQKEISSLDGRIQDRTTSYRLSVLKELTSEQREKIRINSGNNEFGPPRKGFGFAQHLDLSQNQLDALRESRSRYDAEITDLRNNLAMKWMEMRKLFKDPKTDEALLIAKQKDISARQQQLIDKRAQMMMTVLLSILIARVLFTIMAFDFPFTGDVSVSPDAFRHMVLL